MPSERVLRKIDQLLGEAERAIDESNWTLVRARSEQALALDPENADALAFRLAADRASATVSNAAPQTLSDAKPTQAAEEASPTSFAGGRYQVKRFLGEGGKKRVYLAHDNTLDRDVAFALIKTDGLDGTARERISREAQAMGKLGTHPHIVTVFDLGTEPPLPQGEGGGEGTPYIVTELMGGGDVEGLIEQAPEHRPPLQRTLQVGIEVCRGLEFAHSHGIVHRDLKPGNVWLTAPPLPGLGEGRGEGSVAKLGDFGLAVALDKSRLTQAGMMVGTVSYMPPEQAMGSEVTPRSDLYSLGAMLYEMVTGRPPFVGDESVAIITQHLNSPPVSPSWHNASVPSVLESLILRLLEKDPAKRPASAADVREALEAVAQSALHPSLPASLPQGERGDGLPPSPLEGEGLGMRGDNPMYRRTFVGREHELQELQRAFDGAVSGQGALVMVVGEPGIGKTSLCEQLATYAAIRGGRTLVGHCYEEGSLSIPYLPFVEAMRSYVLAREPEQVRTELGSGAGDVARIVSEVQERLRVEPSPGGGDSQDERYRLLQAVTSFLRNAAGMQPLVIVLEDLHDADRGTLEMLLHLSRALAGSRLLIVGTYRDIEVDRAHPLSSTLAELRRGVTFSRVLLRGLTAGEVQRMMSSIGGQEIRWETAEAVYRQTEGNPLFVQEVLRYLVEEGLIRREGGRWRISGETPLAMSIPEGLRDVIGKRLARLSPECNHLLAIAAVIGREFALETLQAVAAVAEEDLVDALEEAVRVAVLQEQARAGSVRYRFAHAFFRQTLYEETIAPRRIRMHQQVARALEAQYSGRLGEHAAELAEHYAYSSDPADLTKAVEYGELAAQRALSVYAYGEAERHLQQTIQVQEVLNPDDRAKRCDLLLALGEAILPGEDPRRAAVSAAPEAFDLAEALADGDRGARAAVLALEALWRASSDTGTYRSPEIIQWAERADRYAPLGSSERIYADVYLGMSRLLSGPAAAHPFLRRAAEAALKGEDSEAFFMAAGWTLRHLNALQDRPIKAAVADQILRRPRLGARSADLAHCLLNLGSTLLGRGDRRGAEGAWTELAGLAARTRDALVLTIAKRPGMILAFLDGRLDDALTLYDELQALSRIVQR